MGAETADSSSDTSRAGRQPVEFSAEGIRSGFVRCVPLALGVAGYGIVFGMLARRAGLSVAEAALMSATVLAGAAQLIAVELWATPVPVVAVLLTTLVVNLRYLLMGAALRPWFGRLSAVEAYGSVFFIADENWALTMRELRSGSRRGAFLLGSGLAIWLFWVTATVFGAVAGDAVGRPSTYGLDFVLTAVFIALAVGLWEGRSNLLPWASAFGVAVVAARYLPGRWYIILGGIVGSLVAVVRFDE